MRLTDEQKAAFKSSADAINPAEERKILASYGPAAAKAKERGAGHELLEKVALLWNMLWEPGYEISWSLKSWLLGGLAYFICPVDLIPDVIPALGYVDDLAVVAWVCTQVGEEIDVYRRWATTHPHGESWLE